MLRPPHRSDPFAHPVSCLACGASLAGKPVTVSVELRLGSALETSWRTCSCGAMWRCEYVRPLAAFEARARD
jgi:hypothetical protein